MNINDAAEVYAVLNRGLHGLRTGGPDRDPTGARIVITTIDEGRSEARRPRLRQVLSVVRAGSRPGW